MGDFKPLIHIGSRSLLGHAITLFRDCGIDDVLVVTGHRSEEAIMEIERYGCRYVFNEKYQSGMFSSMQAGITALDSLCKAFLILPVDTPLVKKETIDHLVATFHRNPGYSVYYPVLKGKKGHPPLIHSKLIEVIVNDSGDKGMRGILNRYEDESISVPVNDIFILRGANNRKELLELEELYATELQEKNNLPSP